ncbi:MAG: hypothetical protein PHI18_04730 [bacterium]|nr:hypothetical protein [bacterium]
MPEENQNFPDVPRGQLLPIGAKFWDASTKEHGLITAELQAIAAAVSNQIVLGDAMRIDGLFKLRTYRAYRGWGYHSFEECAEAMFGVARSQAHALANLGEKRFLLGSVAEEAGKPAEEYTKALDAQTTAIQRSILRLPYDELKATMEGMWESPDGQKLSPSEVLNKIGGDLHGKLKEEKGKRQELETEIKTLTNERDKLLKIAKGETTVAADLAKQLEHTQQRLEKLTGQREQGARAQKELDEARAKMADAHKTLEKYMPRSEDDDEWEKHGEEFGISAGICTEYAGLLERVVQVFAKFHAAREG